MSSFEQRGINIYKYQKTLPSFYTRNLSCNLRRYLRQLDSSIKRVYAWIHLDYQFLRFSGKLVTTQSLVRRQGIARTDKSSVRKLNCVDEYVQLVSQV